jgi:hypothetical protein
MRRTANAMILGCLTLALPGGVLAASPAMGTHATLNVVKPFKTDMAFKHAMAGATLHYTKGDVTIKVTADNLPKPSTLRKAAYVVFATDGSMSARVGTLKLSGNMAAVTGQVMMTKVQDIYIYAETTPNAKHPNGLRVMAGMVG